MTGALLTVRGLQTRYGDVTAIRDIAFSLRAGGSLAILGANGAGKSTLLKTLIGLLRAHSGAISLAGNRIEAMRPGRRARLGIGYCPEGRRCFPGLTVRENLQVACWGDRNLRQARLEEMFARFPVLRARDKTRAWQLSGGQQQMLAIGRALMNAPRLVLLDEPCLGLSPRLADEVLDLVPRIAAGGTAVLIAEQKLVRALAVCDEALVLRLGRIAARGPAADIARDGAARSALLGG